MVLPPGVPEVEGLPEPEPEPVLLLLLLPPEVEGLLVLQPPLLPPLLPLALLPLLAPLSPDAEDP